MLDGVGQAGADRRLDFSGFQQFAQRAPAVLASILLGLAKGSRVGTAMGFGFVSAPRRRSRPRGRRVVVHQEAADEDRAVIEYCGTPMRLPASLGDLINVLSTAIWPWRKRAR